MRKCTRCCTEEPEARPLTEFEAAVNEEALLTFTRLVGISNAYHQTVKRSKQMARGMCDRECKCFARSFSRLATTALTRSLITI